MGSQIILNNDINDSSSGTSNKDNFEYVKLRYWLISVDKNSIKENVGTIQGVILNNETSDHDRSSTAFIVSIITKKTNHIDLNYVMNSYREINIELIKSFIEDELTCYCLLFTINSSEKTIKSNKGYINEITKQFSDITYMITDNIKQMYTIESDNDIIVTNDSVHSQLNKCNDTSLFISSLIELYIKVHKLSVVSNISLLIESKEKLLDLNKEMEFDLKQSNNQMIIDDNKLQMNNQQPIEDNDDDEPIEDLDEKVFELPTQRRQLEQSVKLNDNNNNDITEIIPNFLYLGNYKIAKNFVALKERGITHIINCSADTCDNHYESEIAYLRFVLKDSINENIECIFYYSFEFIQRSKETNGKTLIHCYQGISRSASLVIAYLIYYNNLTCSEAFDYVHNLRNMINPNISFFLQLELFEKRIRFERKRDQEITLFSVGSIQKDVQFPLVCRLIYENISKILSEMPILPDKGLYLLIFSKANYILIGKNISQINKEEYMKTVMEYYKLLIKYENGNPNEPIVIQQMPYENIIMLLGLSFEFGNGSNGLNQYNIELTNGNTDKEMEAKTNQMEKVKYYNRKGFYFYPKKEVYSVLSFDDLSSEELIIACVDQETIGSIMHIWQGEEVNITQKEVKDYIDFVKGVFFSKGDDIVEIIEVPYEESEDFINLL